MTEHVGEPVQATRDCPFCGETVLAVAILCRYCRSDLLDESRSQSLSGVAHVDAESSKRGTVQRLIVGLGVLGIVAFASVLMRPRSRPVPPPPRAPSASSAPIEAPPPLAPLDGSYDCLLSGVVINGSWDAGERVVTLETPIRIRVTASAIVDLSDNTRNSVFRGFQRLPERSPELREYERSSAPYLAAGSRFDTTGTIAIASSSDPPGGATGVVRVESTMRQGRQWLSRRWDLRASCTLLGNSP